MPLKPYNEIYLSSIANALRSKIGTSSTYTVGAMAPAINTYNNYYLKDLFEGNFTALTLSDFLSVSYNRIFRGCSKLSYISLPNATGTLGRSYFDNCPKLQEIYAPGITSIGSYAFNNCINLSSITFGLVSNVETSAFQNCELLSSVPFFDNTVSKLNIGTTAFANTGINKVNINISNLSLAGGVFASCKNLSSVNLPNYSYSIQGGLFRNCPNLTYVSMPKAISIIGSETFSSCTKLISVYIPLRTSIGSNAFYSCSMLPSVSFSLVTNIGQQRFAYCYSLSAAYIPLCTIIQSYAFRNCSSLSLINAPSCTSIGMYRFANCISLSEVNMSALNIVESYAFTGCIFNSINLPVITSLGRQAFQSCSYLSYINLGNFSSSILSSTFHNDRILLSLYLSNFCTLDNINAFMGTPISTNTTYTGGVYGSIYVPSSLLASYKAATNWATYSSRFVGI